MSAGCVRLGEFGLRVLEVGGQGQVAPLAEFLGDVGELAFDQVHAVAAQLQAEWWFGGGSAPGCGHR
jgi:hypothetical protein